MKPGGSGKVKTLLELRLRLLWRTRSLIRENRDLWEQMTLLYLEGAKTPEALLKLRSKNLWLLQGIFLSNWDWRETGWLGYPRPWATFHYWVGLLCLILLSLGFLKPQGLSHGADLSFGFMAHICWNSWDKARDRPYGLVQHCQDCDDVHFQNVRAGPWSLNSMEF